jgi:ankyrin repeat protein
MHHAAKFGHKIAIDLLVLNGGAMELRDLVEGRTPFHLAAQYGRLDCVRALREYKCKINRRSVNDKFTGECLMLF